MPFSSTKSDKGSFMYHTAQAQLYDAFGNPVVDQWIGKALIRLVYNMPGIHWTYSILGHLVFCRVVSWKDTPWVIQLNMCVCVGGGGVTVCVSGVECLM